MISDHPIGRIGLESCLRKLPGAGPCLVASTAREALQPIRRFNPDLIVIDVSAPGANHLCHIKDLHGAFPEIPILTFSNQPEALYAERALRFGAKGYVTEHLGEAQLALAVNHLLAGHVFVPEEAADKLLLGVAAGKRTSRSPLHLLSERELQVFELTGEGKSIADLARELGISRKTVGTHRCHLRRKLGVRTAFDLLEYAFRWAQTQPL